MQSIPKSEPPLSPYAARTRALVLLVALACPGCITHTTVFQAIPDSTYRYPSIQHDNSVTCYQRKALVDDCIYHL